MQQTSRIGAQEIFYYPASVRRKPFGICSSKNIFRTRCKVRSLGVGVTDISLPSVNLNAGWGGVGGQRHAPAALPPGRAPAFYIGIILTQFVVTFILTVGIYSKTPKNLLPIKYAQLLTGVLISP